MKKPTINRMQMLAGLITESQYNRNKALSEVSKKLSPEEQKIFDDITNSIDEGFDDVIEKIKRYAKKGLMTTALLSSLLAPNLGFSQTQQQQIKDIAQTEMQSEFSNQEVWDDIKNNYLDGYKITKPSPNEEALNWGIYGDKNYDGGLGLSISWNKNSDLIEVHIGYRNIDGTPDNVSDSEMAEYNKFVDSLKNIQGSTISFSDAAKDSMKQHKGSTMIKIPIVDAITLQAAINKINF